MTKRKALITGGAGFIGHHLARLLLDEGLQVLVLDNLSVGKHENIAPLKDLPGFGLAVTDMTDEEACLDVVARFLPDVVFHLAAIHFIPYCSAHPVETIRTNVLGTQHLLEALKSAPSVKRFIFASTADVYQPQEGPNIEDETPLGRFNIYGVSKLFGEELIRYYTKISPEVTFVIARLFNTYGPGETNPHVIPDILTYMRDSNNLMLGNVESKRDFIYASDVAEALIALSDESVPATVLNIATGEEYSVRELVQTIAEITGRDLEIVQDPDRFRPSERSHLLGDISKICQLTQWRPKHSLKDGLTKLLEWESVIKEQ
jgi:UDP-glucose 4-epimerase